MQKIFTLCAAAMMAVSMLATEGALSGKFSIDDQGKQVVFSQGNLQYQASTQTWQFAENQYDLVGPDNANISDTYDGWIDLFGGGTGNNPTTTEELYVFSEWGANAIRNGGNADSLWRTLSAVEWEYIHYYRPYAENKRGQATVNGIKGFVVLPDEWTLPEGLTFRSNADGTGETRFSSNNYNTDQWAQMEANGALFLPAAQYRYEAEYTTPDIEEGGWYWTASLLADESSNFSFHDQGDSGFSSRFNNYGLSVRLVQDVEEGQAIDNTSVGVKAVKRIIDGQLFIERGDKHFNILGAEVK